MIAALIILPWLPLRRAPLNMKTNTCWTVEWLFAYVEFVQGWRACRAKSLICGHKEKHRNNILDNLKYGRGANCERSHYMNTARRKCFATAENLQVQSDHQTVTLHLAWRLRSADGYLAYRQGRIRCHAFVCCSRSHSFPFLWQMSPLFSFIFCSAFWASLSSIFCISFISFSYAFVFIPPSSATFPSNFLIPPFLVLFLSLFVVSHT